MPFQAILSTLVETHAPVARAAIFCDDQGERVGSFALDGIETFDVDLLGAAYAPVAFSMPADACLRVLHRDRVVWLATVEGGYYLVILCERRADGGVRADLARAVAALAAHM